MKNGQVVNAFAAIVTVEVSGDTPGHAVTSTGRIDDVLCFYRFNMKNLRFVFHPPLANSGHVHVDSIFASSHITDGLYKGFGIATGTSTTSAKTGYTYVALGDSVAAGIGLDGAYGRTVCGKTTQAYSFTVAKYLGTKPASFACSGATVGDLVTQQQVDGPNPSAQLTNAFGKGTPKFITITAGANDAHWNDFIKKCYAMTCGTATDTAAANGLLSTMQLKLHYGFSSIEKRSKGNPPKVLITGYYNPLSSACKSAKLTASELNWLNAEAKALNQTIKNVSSYYNFVEYVPVSFAGHDICSSKPWVQGLTAKAPFHPTATGQKVIGNAVVAALKN